MAAWATLFDSLITFETEFSAQSRLLVNGSNVSMAQSWLIEPIKSVGRICTSGQELPNFFHFRPTYAVFAQQLLSVNASAFRPRYAVFGGQVMP